MREHGKPETIKMRKKMERSGITQPELDKMKNWLDSYETIVMNAYDTCGYDICPLLSWLSLYSFSAIEKMSIISMIKRVHLNLSGSNASS